jgi:outer membrane protein assembly factor BamD (BamD/ComL family)
VGVLVTWPLAHLLESSRQAEPEKLNQLVSGLNDRLLQFSLKLDTIAEQQLLSDRAKSVAYRDKDRDVLRKAIRQDLDRKDWEAALVLAEDMERMFGYKQEADRIRLEVNAHRADVIGKIIAASAQTIEQHCRAERWADAQREAEKLLNQFPTHEQVQKLPKEIDGYRLQHKKQLIDSWHDAVERKDVDGSIEILKRLDTYLSPMEAAALQEAARNIFKEKLHSLSAEFEQAVKDHKWSQAVRIGDQVMRDFPNSGIARELHERMEGLRKRAAGEAAEVAHV